MANSSTLVRVTDEEFNEKFMEMNLQDMREESSKPASSNNPLNVSKAFHIAQLSARRRKTNVPRAKTFKLDDLAKMQNSSSTSSNRFNTDSSSLDEQKDNIIQLPSADGNTELLNPTFTKSLGRKPTLQVLDFKDIKPEEEQKESPKSPKVEPLKSPVMR